MNELESFFPTVHIRDTCKNKLAIITSFFNPCNYISLKHNFLTFKNHIVQFADLFVIELSFNNIFFVNHSNHIGIHGSYDKNVLWQKERLLNILLEQIPDEYTNIAWIDSDIIFHDPYWVVRLNDMLSRYKVVQLYDVAYREELPNKKVGARLKHTTYGAPGFAWAARREVIEEIKFLDTQIMGAADFVMCSAFMKCPSMLNQLSYYIDNENTRLWINKTSEVVNRSVSYLDNTITHLYHGTEKNRNYSTRYDIVKENKINNIIIQNNLWTSLDPTICADVFDYFKNRMDDDSIIILDKYFDKIYIIDEMDKQTNYSLTKYSISYQVMPSTIDALKDAKHNSYNQILLLNREALLCTNFDVQIQALKNIKNWKLLYLGAKQYDWSNIKEHMNNFYYANNTVGDYAYGVDCSIYDQLINHQDHISIQKEYPYQCFVMYPNLCSLKNDNKSLFRWNIYDYE